MAKFHGKVGFSQTEETSPGVFDEVITERDYKGFILRDVQNQVSSGNINPDFNINNRFSIVADAYANENLDRIRYITYKSTKWVVNSVEIRRPRLILSVRGVYNG
jgi:hypothetical protein